jgi:transposase
MFLRPLPPISDDDIQRFWSRVALKSNNECWLWLGSCGDRGYGLFSINQEHYVATRVSWYIHHGEDPHPHLVLHNCPGHDNPSCINAAHLYLGDHSQNMQDAYDKGQKPSMQGWSYERKLTLEDEVRIKELYQARRVTLEELGTQFAVGKSTISRIVNGYFDGQSIQTNRCKLSEADQAEIRRQHLFFGISRKELARRYKVGESTINRLINRS